MSNVTSLQLVVNNYCDEYSLFCTNSHCSFIKYGSLAVNFVMMCNVAKKSFFVFEDLTSAYTFIAQISYFSFVLSIN